MSQPQSPMPSAHIITVNYNSGEWLQRSIKSALKHSEAQISVVDNASTDNSVEVTQSALQTHSCNDRIVWKLNTCNLGFAAANNQVLRHLTQDYAVLMNPDCELRAETLPRIFAAFEAEPKFGLLSCRILNEDLSLQATCRRRFPTPWAALVRMLQLHRVFPNNPKFANFDYGDDIDEQAEPEVVEAISGAFMVVRKQALEDVGLLDEAYFMHCEDLDWCKRFHLAGWQVGFVASAEVVHAKGVGSKSRPIAVLYTLHKGMNRFFDKFYQADYSWPLRYTVKLGIIASFVARASLALIRSAVRK